jgi:hypothetical protein
MIVLLLIAILITLLGAWAVVAALALGGAVYVVAVGALLLLAAPILLPFHAWLDRRFAPQPPPQLARLVFEPRRDRRATAKRPSAQDGASEGDDPLMTKTTNAGVGGAARRLDDRSIRGRRHRWGDGLRLARRAEHALGAARLREQVRSEPTRRGGEVRDDDDARRRRGEA